MEDLNKAFIDQITDIITKKQDNAILDRLHSFGLDINNLEELSKHFTKVIKDGDEFEHYYYKFGTPQEIRLLSIEKYPTLKMVEKDGGSVTIEATQKMY